MLPPLKNYPAFQRYSTPKPLLHPLPTRFPSINRFRTSSLSKDYSIDFEQREKDIRKGLETTKVRRNQISAAKVIQKVEQKCRVKITVKNPKLSSEDLIKEALYLFQKCKSEKAAALIQRSWRKYTWFRVTKALQDRRNYSAFLIQRAWIRHKTYKAKKLKLQTARKDAALKIQKNYRGYKAREHFNEIHSKKVLQENLEYFDKVKRELYKESIARISKAWSDFKAIKAAKAELKRLKEIERRKRIERLKEQKTRYFTKTEEVPVESFAVSTESTNTPVNNTPKNRHITNCRVRSLDPYS